MLIDESEFHSNMREKLGFKGPDKVLKELFRQLDTDGSGHAWNA